MGLGSRNARRHETRVTAGVSAEEYWDFKPGQTVMTVDGFLGKVTAVYDGPLAGTEEYEVTLNNGLGGGTYTASQLQAASAATASHENTAARDYPELAEILTSRPDPGKYPSSTLGLVASLQKEAGFPLCAAGCNVTLGAQDALVDTDQGLAHEACLQTQADLLPGTESNEGKPPGLCDNGHLKWGDTCPACRDTPVGQNAMVVNEGDNKPNPQVTAGAHHWDDEDDVALQYHLENPPKGDGCTICGDSDHENSSHVDDALGPRRASLEHGYALVRMAAQSPSFGFHVTAAWKDVRAKARRIRSQGGVHITASQNGFVVAQVKGDHDVYESVLMRAPGSQKVAQWDCGCPWATYHWGAPDDFSRFAGRMCSHALALHFEAQSRGMFGKEVSTDSGAPSWMRKKHLDLTASKHAETLSELPDCAPIHVFAAQAIHSGEDAAEVLMLLSTIAAVSSPFGEPGPNPVPWVAGPTAPRNPNENPASAGPLSTDDPQGWNQQSPGGLGGVMGSLDEAVFEPEPHQASLDKEGWAQLIVPLVRAVGPKVLEKAAPSLLAGGIGGGGKDDDEDKAGSPEESGKSDIPDADPMTPKSPMDRVNDFAKELSAWTDRSKAEGDAVRRSMVPTATLHEQPEPALPSTDGTEGPTTDGEAMAMGLQDDVTEAREDLGLPPLRSAIDTGMEYAVPADAGSSGGGMGPGTNFKSDPTSLEPEDPSFVSTGSTGGVEDIVAQFQRTAGASALGGSAGGPAPISRQRQENGEIALAAKAFLEGGQEALTRTAMAVFSPAEQQELIGEGEGSARAANLDRLEITGTHYESLDRVLGGDEDELWLS